MQITDIGQTGCRQLSHGYRYIFESFYKGICKTCVYSDRIHLRLYSLQHVLVCRSDCSGTGKRFFRCRRSCILVFSLIRPPALPLDYYLPSMRFRHRRFYATTTVVWTVSPTDKELKGAIVVMDAPISLELSWVVVRRHSYSQNVRYRYNYKGYQPFCSGNGLQVFC